MRLTNNFLHLFYFLVLKFKILSNQFPSGDHVLNNNIAKLIGAVAVIVVVVVVVIINLVVVVVELLLSDVVLLIGLVAAVVV